MKPDNPMHMIAYISDLVSPVREDGSNPDAVDTALLLRTIQQQATARNEALNITGILMFWDGSFFQLLEGEREAVSQVFTSIGRDHRHCNIRCLIDEPIHERLFSKWRMRCLNLNSDRTFDKSELVNMMTAYRNTFQPSSKSLLSVLRRTLPLQESSL